MAARASSTGRMNPEERVGLIVALAAHVGLFAWLALDPLGKSVQPPPDRMTVTFADEVALESTSPEPAADAAPDVASARGEAPPEAEPVPVPMAETTPLPAPAPALKPKPAPTPLAKAQPKLQSKVAPRPAPATQPRRRPDAPKGASRVGNDFLKGLPGGQAAGAATSPPAAKAGPQVAASLSQAIARQLKPKWVAPQGAEADQLVTVLAWDLNRDGSLAGRPRVVSQSGVTDANRAQQARHAEQAIRAVQLASPFDLPAQYYDSWKRVATFRFDRKLSQ
jgi:hypothetical protein